MPKKIVSASSVGKTAYCPHAHYLSHNRKPDKKSMKRMASGETKHKKITFQAKQDNKKNSNKVGYLPIIIIIVAILILIGWSS